MFVLWSGINVLDTILNPEDGIHRQSVQCWHSLISVDGLPSLNISWLPWTYLHNGCLTVTLVCHHSPRLVFHLPFGLVEILDQPLILMIWAHLVRGHIRTQIRLVRLPSCEATSLGGWLCACSSPSCQWTDQTHGDYTVCQHRDICISLNQDILVQQQHPPWNHLDIVKAHPWLDLWHQPLLLSSGFITVLTWIS